MVARLHRHRLIARILKATTPAHSRLSAEQIAADRLAKAWQQGWEAGCNDQQFGDENAEPWTPNPYRGEGA
jgi:hypothetical protein